MNQMNRNDLGAPAAPAAPAPNLIQRIGLAFTAPSALGRHLRAHSPWIVALVIIAAITVALVLLMPADILQQTVEARAAGRPRPEGQPQPTVTQMRTFGAIFGFLGVFVGAAIVAGALYLVFNVLFGQAETSYRQHLSTVAHAWYILTLGSILEFGLKMVQGDGMLRLSFGLLLAEAPESYFGYVLDSISLFGLWTAAALGVVESGLSEGKVSAGKASGAVIALYIAFAAISAGFRSLGGG